MVPEKGLDYFEIRQGLISLLVSKSVGPRILSFSYQGGKNIFAELPNEYLEYPGTGKYFFYGGHRLWLAPENPLITYIPDDQPIKIIQSPGLIDLIQETILSIGIQKSIRIKFTEYNNVLIIDHFLHNQGDHTFVCAPWAITQFRLGGKAILPQQSKIIDRNQLLPDRSIILWPYADINDPRIDWSNQFIIINAIHNDKAFKIGIKNTQKWMAYFIEHLLFIKYFGFYVSNHFVDGGATSEVYCNSKFIELETVRPLEEIRPKSTVRHREIWRIVDSPFDSATQENILNFFTDDEMNDVCINLL